MTTNQHRVLVVDDDPEYRSILSKGLKQYCQNQTPPLDWEITQAMGRPNALNQIQEARELGRSFAVVVTDLIMDGDPQSGVELIRAVPGIDPLVMCILYTVQPGAFDRIDTSDLGAFHEVAKESKTNEWMIKRIFERIKAAINHREKILNEATLSQFFTRRMVERLTRDPKLLEPQRKDTTILFCDVRKFSAHRDKLESQGFNKPFEWIRDVMEKLSECVVKHQGEVIDFIGDELMALWGAPEEQPDHALRACRAAMAMLEALPELQARWEVALGERMEIGIGLDSGRVLVGNTGTKQRSKYGPLGEAVNRASRIQGATKHLLTRLLITKETYSFLDGHPLTQGARKVCEFEVKNPDRNVVVYDLDNNERRAVLNDYPKALDAFSLEKYQAAIDLLAPLVATPNKDGPSGVLLFRAIQGLREGKAPKHPVFILPSK